MPLGMPINDAVTLAVRRIEANEGSLVGVVSYIRSLGAHYEQAKSILEKAASTYESLKELLPEADTSKREVTVSVESADRELNITLKADRLPVTTFDELVEFYDIDTEVWQPSSKLFNFWGNKENPNFQVKARFVKNEYVATVKEDRESFRQWAKELAPTWDTGSKSPASEGSLMLEIVLSDLHADRAEHQKQDWWQELIDATIDMIDTALFYRPGKVAEVNLVLLGDTFNSEGRRGTTTRGTPQDDAPSWREGFSNTRQVISMLATYAYETLGAKVNLRVIAGNHDFERSYYLNDSLWAYFSEHPGVNVILDDGIRQYIRWGSTVIGLTHGDSAKPQDLAMTMLREAPNGETYQWHLGHFHTRREDELHGVVIRYFGTPSVAGEWDKTKAYGNNRREVVSMLFDKDKGEVASFRQVLGG